VDDFTTRPYRDADAAQVADLLNVIEVAGDCGHQFTEAEIRGLMSTDLQDAASDSRLVFGPDGSLAAVGTVSPPPAGGSRASADGGVHPRWRGSGIGRTLLSWQLERIAGLRAEHDPASEWIADTGAGLADQSAARLFKQFDLQPVRYFLEMSAPTADVRPARPPDDVRIVAFTGELRAAVYESHMDAFADHWGFARRDVEEWAARTIESDLFRADLSWVALVDDQPAAYLLAYDGPENSFHIGQVGTRQPWRKRGLATALLAASLAAGAADGKTTASLGVDADSPTGAVSVYERLGFTTEHSPYVVYEKTLAD